LSGVNATEDPLRYNPHCLKRDMNPFIGQAYNSLNWTTWTVEQSPDIVAFQSRMAGDQGQGHGNYTLNQFGVHGGGHFFLGGMTGQSKRVVAFSDLLAFPCLSPCPSP